MDKTSSDNITSTTDNTTSSTDNITSSTDNITSTTIVNLFHAVEENDEAAVNYFLEEKKVNVSDTDYNDDTGAHLAARTGNLNMVKVILKRDPTIISFTNAEGDTILFLAVKKDHLHVVKFLVEEYKADISQKNNHIFDCTAIHIAAQFGQLGILKYFIGEKKGDPNVTNKVGETPMFLAAENKHHHIVKYLVEETKADPTIVDSEKNSVLYVTIKKNDLTLMKYFLDERKIHFDLNWRNALGRTLVHQAAILNRLDFLKYLVGEKNADVNIPDNTNMTPLHNAALRKHFETCKYLVEHGANVTAKDYRDYIPVQYSADRRLTQYLEKVVQKRERRSVQEPSIFIPFEAKQQKLQRITADSYSSHPIADLDEGSFSPLEFSYFQNFLVIAQAIIGVTQNSINRLISRSPEENVQSRIDPVAIAAVRRSRYYRKIRRS